MRDFLGISIMTGVGEGRWGGVGERGSWWFGFVFWLGLVGVCGAWGLGTEWNGMEWVQGWAGGIGVPSVDSERGADSMWKVLGEGFAKLAAVLGSSWYSKMRG